VADTTSSTTYFVDKYVLPIRHFVDRYILSIICHFVNRYLSSKIAFHRPGHFVEMRRKFRLWLTEGFSLIFPSTTKCSSCLLIFSLVQNETCVKTNFNENFNLVYSFMTSRKVPRNTQKFIC